jgi:hypothetical protein
MSADLVSRLSETLDELERDSRYLTAIARGFGITEEPSDE